MTPEEIKEFERECGHFISTFGRGKVKAHIDLLLERQRATFYQELISLSNAGRSDFMDQLDDLIQKYQPPARKGGMIELKDCPFCGGDARLLEWKKGKCRYVIGCSNGWCIIFLPVDVRFKERMNYVSGCWVYKDELIKAWNTRKET